MTTKLQIATFSQRALCGSEARSSFTGSCAGLSCHLIAKSSTTRRVKMRHSDITGFLSLLRCPRVRELLIGRRFVWLTFKVGDQSFEFSIAGKLATRQLAQPVHRP